MERSQAHAPVGQGSAVRRDRQPTAQAHGMYRPLADRRAELPNLYLTGIDMNRALHYSIMVSGGVT